jgi:threonine/homoserine/homoserine lactone efflux protein
MIVDLHRRRRAWLTTLLGLFGLACLFFYGVATLSAWFYQRHAKAELERAIVPRAEVFVVPPSRGEQN